MGWAGHWFGQRQIPNNPKLWSKRVSKGEHCIPQRTQMVPRAEFLPSPVQSNPPVITLQPCPCHLHTPKAENEGVFHPRGSSSPNRWEMVQAGHGKARLKHEARLVTNTITPGCQRSSSNGLHPAGEMGRVLGGTSITSLPPVDSLPPQKPPPPFPSAVPGTRHFAIYTCHTKNLSH